MIPCPSCGTLLGEGDPMLALRPPPSGLGPDVRMAYPLISCRCGYWTWDPTNEGNVLVFARPGVQVNSWTSERVPSVLLIRGSAIPPGALPSFSVSLRFHGTRSGSVGWSLDPDVLSIHDSGSGPDLSKDRFVASILSLIAVDAVMAA